jgi:hypothetical protein
MISLVLLNENVEVALKCRKAKTREPWGLGDLLVMPVH